MKRLGLMAIMIKYCQLILNHYNIHMNILIVITWPMIVFTVVCLVVLFYDNYKSMATVEGNRPICGTMKKVAIKR